jgi:thymidylate synthase
LEVARDLGIKWWDEWDVGNGSIGNRYGFTIKRYDLMNKLLDGLKNNPFSRRHIIDMFQYQDLEETNGLYPCAYSTSWSVRKVDDVYYIDMTLNQRSNDYIMAGFINKIQYVALQMMVVGHLNKYGMKTKVGKFCHLVKNLHVYDRHLDAMQEILERDPLDINPCIVLNENKDFYDYTLSDFTVKNIKGIEKLKSPLEIAI